MSPKPWNYDALFVVMGFQSLYQLFLRKGTTLGQVVYASPNLNVHPSLRQNKNSYVYCHELGVVRQDDAVENIFTSNILAVAVLTSYVESDIQKLILRSRLNGTVWPLQSDVDWRYFVM